MEIIISDESDIQKGVRRALLKLGNQKGIIRSKRDEVPR